MLILVTMFVKLFSYQCFLCLSKGFFLLFQNRKIAKAKKQPFFKMNHCQKIFSNACADQQRFIILK